jgi:large subunit ribosomal protein L6
MSRIGKQPVAIPGNVKVSVSARVVTVESGPKKLTFNHRPEISVKVDDKAKAVVVERQGNDRLAKALHGMTRAMISNMVMGVTAGFSKELEVNGVGWSAKVQGQMVVLNIGFADPRQVKIPAGVKVEITQNKIKISGPEKQAVGQLAAEVRSQRPPEPYNGKGIKYIDERIIKKAGKAFAGGKSA